MTRTVLIGLVMVAACSGEPARDAVAPVAVRSPGMADASPAQSPKPEPTLPRATGEPSPGGKPITLGALEPDDGADLTDELRCGFMHGDRTLLLAAADVDPQARATAVVRNGGVPERLVARAAGGFDALTHGGAFGGRGLTAEVTRGAAEATGTEATRHRATLRLDRADGAVRVYRGTWTCGP